MDLSRGETMTEKEVVCAKLRESLEHLDSLTNRKDVPHDVERQARKTVVVLEHKLKLLLAASLIGIVGVRYHFYWSETLHRLAETFSYLC
jgi:uncharacterized protein (UPF0147 family)